jgi:thiol-disulfide isomerase/thioredoxin
MKRTLKLAVFATAVAVLAGCTSEGPTKGSLVPDFEVKALAGAKPTKVSDLKGKVVVLDFWATYCGPCRESMPELAEMYKELKPKGMEVMSITTEPRDLVSSFAQRAPFNLPYYLDSFNLANSRLDITSLPTTVVVDRTGKIVFRETGYGGSLKELREAVEKAL